MLITRSLGMYVSFGRSFQFTNLCFKLEEFWLVYILTETGIVVFTVSCSVSNTVLPICGLTWLFLMTKL